MEALIDRRGPVSTPTGNDAGWDLESAVDVLIPPRSSARVPTGARVACSPGIWYTIALRSSMSANDCIVPFSVLDPGYNGELFVLIHNMGNDAVTIKRGERFAQIVFFTNIHPHDGAVEITRGERGWGSSGK